ncbi:MAG: GNAT family N-acetyltransferase [Methanobacteriota archaeon]
MGPGHRVATAPIPVADRGVLRAFLTAEPVATAVVWDRVFQQPRYREVVADAVPPQAVLALSRSRRDGGPTGIAVHATRETAARDVVSAIPTGAAFFHATDEALVDVLKERSDRIEARPAWLFTLDPTDFVDRQAHDVRRVTSDAAPVIARHWEPDWPSERYVRSRIEEGPTAGVYFDGDLVAWAMTHFVTDRVAMLGFFHVLEEHRRKGYGTSAACALTKEVFRLGKTPALHVYVTNTPSLDLVERIGFRRVKRQVWGDAVVR